MSEPLCATCGHPRDNHPYRHPFAGPSKDDTIKELEAKLAKAKAMEAKAIWVNETRGGGLVTFTSKEAALRNVSPHDVRIAVKYVEARDE
jgi:hypothetical protein